MTKGQPTVLLEEYPWQTLKSQNSSALMVSTSRNYHHAAFVYRLGQWVFSPLRGVRFSYAVPDLITLVINPVGDLCRDIFLVTARLC